MIFEAPPENPWRAVLGEPDFMAWAVEEIGTKVDINNKNCLSVAENFNNKTFIKFKISSDKDFSVAYRLKRPQIVVRVKDCKVVWIDFQPASYLILFQANQMRDRKGPKVKHGSKMSIDSIMGDFNELEDTIAKCHQISVDLLHMSLKNENKETVKDEISKNMILKSETLPKRNLRKPSLERIDENAESSPFRKLKEKKRSATVPKEKFKEVIFRSPVFSIRRKDSEKEKTGTLPNLFCLQINDVRSSISSDFYHARSYRPRSSSENFHELRKSVIISMQEKNKLNSFKDKKNISNSSKLWKKIKI